jgi:dienelactone hydrolase
MRAEQQANRIQAVGYCFGGLYTLLAGGRSRHWVDSIVGCHASLTTKAHFEQLDVPVALVCAQEDVYFTEQFRGEVEEILARKTDLPSKVLVTVGTVHGFASRPNPDNAVSMSAYEQANLLIADWAKAHL